jgi:glycosyltransferase involved in cell wall biosynthesis
MPAYNSEAWIARSIDSVLKQTYIDWELIIINDYSKDRTFQIANDYVEKDQRIRLINLSKNCGVSFARNQGINNSYGEFIAFLDSDDLWHPNKLKCQLAFHDKYPECKISHTNFDLIGQDGPLKIRFKFFNSFFIKKSGLLYRQLIYTNCIGTLTVMVKKEVLIQSDLFDVSQYSLEDQDLWLRISMLGYQFGYINIPLSYYRLHEGGISSDNSKFKTAYIRFLEKHKVKMIESGFYSMALSYYFRYFGRSYFKDKKFDLAFINFKNAVTNNKKFFFLITTLPYCFISFAYCLRAVLSKRFT